MATLDSGPLVLAASAEEPTLPPGPLLAFLLLALIIAVLALARRRYGLAASSGLAMLTILVGQQLRPLVANRAHIGLAPFEIYLALITGSGVAVYALVAGIQELRSLDDAGGPDGADGGSRPRP